MSSKKIKDPSYKAAASGNSEARNPMAETNTLGGGVGMHGGSKGRAPNAGTDYRDGGSHSIKAKDRRVSSAPTNMKGS